MGKEGGGGWRDERNSDVLILFAIVVDSQQKVVTVGYLQSSSKFQTVIIHVIGSVSLGLLPLDLFPLGLFKWTYSHSTYERRPELFISRELVWPIGKALGWQAEGPRLDSASAFLSLQKGCGLWTLSCDFVPHNC